MLFLSGQTVGCTIAKILSTPTWSKKLVYYQQAAVHVIPVWADPVGCTIDKNSTYTIMSIRNKQEILLLQTCWISKRWACSSCLGRACGLHDKQDFCCRCRRSRCRCRCRCHCRCRCQGSNFQTKFQTNVQFLKPTFKPTCNFSNQLSYFQTKFQTFKPTFKLTFKLSNQLSNQLANCQTNFQTFKPTFKHSNQLSNQPSNFQTNFQTSLKTFKPTFKLSNQL